MAHLQRVSMWSALIMVIGALAAGCADPLEMVRRDAALVSDLGADASDASADQVNSHDVMDAGDEPALTDVPKLEAGEDGDVVPAPDGDVADGGGDVSPDMSDVVQDDGARTDVVGEMLVDASSDADVSSPCPTPGEVTCSGRCTVILTDPNNCGACGRICSIPNGTAGCAAGACTVAACNTGFGDCDGNPANGCEVDLGTSASHCGACNNACTPLAPLCSTSRCSNGCTGMGETLCGSPARCVNMQTDPNNCGACERACAPRSNASMTCAAGSCRYACNRGFHDCAGVCASDTHVTSCGVSCAPCVTPPNAVATCVTGGCGFTCHIGFADCDGVAANGCEANLRESAAHCGRCAAACAPGATCSMGGVCTGLTLTPTFSSRYLLEERGAAGGAVTWMGFREFSTAQYAADGTLTIQSSQGPDFAWPIGRVGMVFTVPATSRIVSASLELQGTNGVYANVSRADVHVVAFRPAMPFSSAENYALSHWGMRTSFGARPLADIRAGSARIDFNADGLTFLTPGGDLGLGLVTNLDREDRQPTIPGATGTNIVPTSLRLRVDYVPR